MKKKFEFNIKEFLNKKENIAILVVAVVFCAGIVISNVKANNIPLHDGDVLVDSQNVSKADEQTSENTFEERRADLELKRNDIISKLDDTIKNTSVESEKKDAISEKKKLIGYMESESEIESIIKTKNLPDSLVIMTDSSISITVDEQNLKQNVVAKICNIVMEQTKRTADKIVIQSSY